MSLIDEALKRARQEAARQDEAAREKRYRQVPVIPGLRQPARRSWLLPVVLAACLAAGIAIGLLVAGRGGDDQRAAAPPPVAAPAAPAPAPVELPAESPQETEDVPVPQVPPTVVEEEPEPAPPVAEERPAPAPPRPQEEPAIADMREREIALSPAPAPPAEITPEPVAPEPAPAPAPVAPGQERVYQQELPLPGGGSLRLNGIAYSEQQPVALFGDKVVGPGETVAGYKVVAIEVRRVRLEGQGGVVVVEMP